MVKGRVKGLSLVRVMFSEQLEQQTIYKGSAGRHIQIKCYPDCQM